MGTLQGALADPALAYALFVVGGCGLLAEAFHPGAIVPGVSGAICLVLALHGFSLLPVSWLSLLLVAVALVLFALDVKVVTHGGLTVAGLAAFAAGSLTLYGMPGSKSALVVPFPLVMLLMVVAATAATLVVRAAVRVRHGPSLHGPQRLLGRTGVATTALTPGGTVRVGGELWSARLCAPLRLVGTESVDGSAAQPSELAGGERWSGVALPPGQPVRIVGRRGLVLEVEPVTQAGGRAARTA